MRNVVRTVCLLAMIGVTPAHASDAIKQHIPNAEKVGEGRFSFMLWDLYDAALYAPNGRWDADQPYALQLSYLRNLSGQKIADKSIEEMRKQGFNDEITLADWHAQMVEIFPDVDKETHLTSIYRGNGETIFFNGSTEIGRVKSREFEKRFFDIWLSQKTSAPTLRAELLGGS